MCQYLLTLKGMNMKILKGSFCIKPNLKEFENIVGKIKNKDDLLKKSKNLIKKLDINYLLLTMGEKGIFLFEKIIKGFEKVKILKLKCQMLQVLEIQ